MVLEEQIYIYDISNMKLLHTIETSPNPQGRFPWKSSASSAVAHVLTPSIFPFPSVNSHLHFGPFVRQLLPGLPISTTYSFQSLQ